MAGTTQLSVTRPFPGVALRFLGADGATALVDGLVPAIADKLAPAGFMARTLKVYNVPFVRFVKVWLVLLDAFTQDAPLLLDT